jgi:hypothetical protein
MINVRLSAALAGTLRAKAAKIPPRTRSTRRNNLRRPWTPVAILAIGRIEIDMEISRIGENREDIYLKSA